MPITQQIAISASVGAGGANRPDDVRVVQEQLNAQMRPPREPLVVDGICGPKTRAMIRDFQRMVCGFNTPDGRVDPGHRTIAALNDPNSKAIWAGVPNVGPLPPDNPSGPVDPVAPCCPDVSTFEGTTGGTTKYFGFDDKTNRVATPNADEYWIPPTDTKTLPADRTTRDGARWISVGVGLQTELQINFGGTFTAGCLVNCTYEVDPVAVAKVVGAKPVATGTLFKIEGLAAGEASLKVMCDGELRGYIHIWCVEPATINVDVIRIVTTRAPAPGISIPALSRELRETLGQAVLSFNVLDLGTVDLSTDAVFTAAEAAFYNGAGEFLHATAQLQALEIKAEAALAGRDATQPRRRPNALGMFYYVPGAVANDVVGKVINVGASPAFTFIDTPVDSENTSAHELGHSLGLEHPLHNTGRDQFAHHLLDTLNTAVTLHTRTNTEPAIAARAGAPNIMAHDPLNLMGYWVNFGEAKPIRYPQWKSCRRTA